MLIYATILRNFIMYIICILIFHLTSPLEKVMTGSSAIFPPTPLTSNFLTFVFFEQ